MSPHDPPPQPPGPPPQPDPGHLLARTGVRWTIIGVLISAVLTVAGWVVQARLTHDDGPGGGASPETSAPTHTPSPGGTTTAPADGLTAAERELRDSLNSDQWQRKSCAHDRAPGSTAALLCAVTAEGITMKADIVLYPSRSKLQEAYQTYASRLPLGNCDVSRNVRGSWHEKGSTLPTGDMVCFTLANGQYVITCTYYERPALFQVKYTDAAAITRWWKTLDPVFTTG
uniref:Serine/threonine protein kinase n=1 Tax=Streptomyces sp. NBC_00003 TaxID=2903608 RepID=A0AAU2VG41_9ACTN